MPEFAKQLYQERPQEIALRFEDKTMNWSDIDITLNKIANGLNKLDLGSQRRIAVFAENALETAVANLGGLIAGASVVPVNFHLTSEEEDGLMTAMVDVKARKRKKRSDSYVQDEWIWVEFKNVRGKDGWLYGLADFIAFETEESFILSFRKELVDWCESKIDLKDKVYSAEEAEYMPYTRKGKQDLISMIQLRDIENLPNTAIWKK